jgi:hypothetical protein
MYQSFLRYRFNDPHRVFEAKFPQAIPRITNEFHSLADIGWYGGAYQLATYVNAISLKTR